MASKIIAAAVAVVTVTAAMAHAATDAGQDATMREIAAMHWQPGPIAAPSSHSKLTPGVGFMLVTGDEVRRLRVLEDGQAPSGLEAEAANFAAGGEILYFYFNEGFITVDDWSSVDPAALLDAIKQNTEEANKVRRQNGKPDLHVTRWIEPPSLNRDTNSVTWVFEGNDSVGGKLINAVALKLGRNGFERIVWIPDLSGVADPLSGFRTAVASHEFEPGYRYSDHVTTDRSAEYGVAGLVAGVLGVKLAKAAGIGGVAALAVLGKKLGFLIILPFIALWRFIKRLFRRQEAN